MLLHLPMRPGAVPKYSTTILHEAERKNQRISAFMEAGDGRGLTNGSAEMLLRHISKLWRGDGCACSLRMYIHPIHELICHMPEQEITVSEFWPLGPEAMVG